MKLKYSNLKKFIYLYLLLPVFLFVAGFLRIPFAVMAGVFAIGVYLLAAGIFSHKKNTDEDKELEDGIMIGKGALIILFLIGVVWCFLGGQGGFFYQSPDWNCRNAIFRDLIRYDWPVYYENTGDALVYYIGHWLPAAVVAKGIYFISGRLAIAWVAGRILLWLWTAIGCFLVMLLMLLYFKAHTKGQMIGTVFMLIFFSGMDVVGTLCNVLRGGPTWIFIPFHFEPWANGLQYSSNTTCLFWVFNQAVAPWICVLCYLLEKKMKNYAVILAGCMMAGPFALVGLSVFAGISIWNKLVKCEKKEEYRSFCKELFTIQNISTLVILFPVILLYYSSNAIVQSLHFTAYIEKVFSIKYVVVFIVLFGILVCIYTVSGKINETAKKYSGIFAVVFAICILLLVRQYVLFYFLEVGALLLLIWRDYKIEWKFYVVALFLAITPKITVGNSSDFMMRASIPALIILMLMVTKSIWKHRNDVLRKAMPTVLLIGCVLIGACTPLGEFYRAISATISAESMQDVICDDKYTLDQETHSGLDNFTAVNPKEQFFFKYLAK